MDENKNQEQMQQNALQTGNYAPVTFNFFDATQFATMQRYSQIYTCSDLVPDSYRYVAPKPEEGETQESYNARCSEATKRAIGNCMIAIDISTRIGASPLMVMQNMVPINGRPSWSSKFLIATINACGRFKPIKYRLENKGKIGKIEYTDYEVSWETGYNGKKYRKTTPRKQVFDGSEIDNIQCVAYTTEKNNEEIMESTPVDIIMAIKEGWYTKPGSKWQTMPIKMLKYRAASFWANEYAPELSMGIYTVEENEDIQNVTEDVPCTIISEHKPAKKTKVVINAPSTQPQADISEQPNPSPSTSDSKPKMGVTKAPIPAQGAVESTDEDDCGY